MDTITIRNIDPALAVKLKKAAKKEGKAVDQVVLEILRRDIGIQKKKYTRKYDDLDHLFGKWTAAEFEQIQAAINDLRKVDKEMWR